MDYIEESVKYRMGKWYHSSFLLNRFDWDKTKNKNYVSRFQQNSRYLEWIKRWKELGIKKNPGILLDSQDKFLYDDFIKNSSFRNILDIPVGSHNRKAGCQYSILFPLMEPTLLDIKNKTIDSYNFLEKKSDVVWRGKFTGSNTKGPWWADHDINGYKNALRYKAVLKWGKKFNIKFSKHFLAMLNYKYIEKNFKPFKGKQKKIVKGFYEDAKRNDMFGDFLDFETKMCKYKYILNLDGHDSSSSIINILQSNSLMIGPIPKWHIVVNFKLEPWEHYVPLKDDTSDLEEKIQWCNLNPKECERIVKKAGAYIEQFNESSEKRIEKKIFEILFQNEK